MGSIFSKKRFLLLIPVLIIGSLIAYNIYKSKTDTSNIITEVAVERDLIQSVLATGQVVSNTDLSLSFKGSGTVKKVNVKTGQKVEEDDILATLDQRDQQAALTSARGALASARANYQRILDGASSEEVEVAQKAFDAAQVTLTNTIKQQNSAVENAYRAYLNGSLQAVTNDNTTSGTVTVSGLYNGSSEGRYHLAVYSTGDGLYYIASELGSISGPIIYGVPMPLGNGISATFSTTGTFSSTNTWDIYIPNINGATYVANYNAYQSALITKDSAISAAQASLNQAQAALDLRKAQAKPADLSAASAQVLSAQGQVEAAQSALENTIIRAPADGTITKVDIKVGELTTSLKEVIVLQDVENLYLEANVSEANVALIEMGQEVEVTFDALGPDREFIALVSAVEPASNVVSGVVNYKITASIDQSPDIRPGMTANMSIQTDSRMQVVAVPQRAIIQKNGKRYVRIVNDLKRKTYDEVEVKTGLEANDGLVEIESGVVAGQTVVTYIGEK